MNHINVKSEFATLKKVVVTQSEFIFPQTSKDTAFLPEAEIREFKKAAGKSYEEAFPQKQKQWELERQNLIDVLESYNVDVLRPGKLTDFQKRVNRQEGCSNFFVRDPFFTVGNIIIEGSLRFKHRRNEILPLRRILTDQAYDSDAMYVAVPKPDVSEGYEAEDGPFLEGGDVLVYHQYVLVGNSGLASNNNGYRWLKHLLEPMGYQVISIPLHKEVLHLDCAMSLVKEGLMIVSEKALLSGIPDIFRGWDKIIIEPEQIKYLTVNGLPVSENVYITDPQFKELVGIKLAQRGITVEYVDFSISRSLGGSFRCSTQALLRE